MRQKRKSTRAARKAAHIHKLKDNVNKEVTKEVVNHEVEVAQNKPEFWEEAINPLIRMLGHTVSSSIAYGLWCLVEIAVARVLKLVFALGTPHQAELFETGETVMFITGFVIWAVTFIVGAIRLVVAETKIFGDKE